MNRIYGILQIYTKVVYTFFHHPGIDSLTPESLGSVN